VETAILNGPECKSLLSTVMGVSKIVLTWDKFINVLGDYAEK